MIAAILSIAAILLILICGEILWRMNYLRGEFSRKFIHITVGTFVAFWPFYLSFQTIQLTSLAFFVVVLVTRRFKTFKAIHTIDRRSLGDALFAISIGLTASLTMSPWIFAAAILHLSLADGFAAIVGKRFGKTNEYKVLGYTKSVVGTATFWVFSLAIISFVLLQGHVAHSLIIPLLIWLPIATTTTENFSVMGLDNLLVPLLVVLILSSLSFAL